MTTNEAARLVANGTHAIYDDNRNTELLRNILSLAFPKDEDTVIYTFKNPEMYYGYDKFRKDLWTDGGAYLQDLLIINLSGITEKEKVQLSLKENSISDEELAFEKVVDETLNHIRETLIVKGKEYRRNNNPFHNFEVGAIKKSISREKVLDGMLLKHEISIEDMTNDLDNGKLPSESSVNEKFGDNLIYLILKKAMFIDRILKSTNN